MKEHNLSIDLDGLLIGKDWEVVVEAREELDTTHVDEQIHRMEKFRRIGDLRGDKRRFFCALAIKTATEQVIEYAHAQGFYIVMPSGKDVMITKPTGEPKFW